MAGLGSLRLVVRRTFGTFNSKKRSSVKMPKRKSGATNSLFNDRLAFAEMAKSYVENGNAEAALEIIKEFKKIRYKGSLNLSRDFSHLMLQDLLQCILKNITGDFRHDLVKSILDMYLLDDGNLGWSQEKAKTIIDVLQNETENEYDVKDGCIQSDGKCENCETILLNRSIPYKNRAKLTKHLYYIIKEKEQKNQDSFLCDKLTDIMTSNTYGIIVDGKTLAHHMTRVGRENDMILAIQEFTKLRKLVILHDMDRMKSSLFSDYNDFDIFYVHSSMPVVLYQLFAALAGNKPWMTDYDLRGVRHDVHEEYRFTLIDWIRTRVVLLRRHKNGNHFIKKPPGLKVKSVEVTKSNHCHLIYRNLRDHEMWSYCIQKV